MSPSSPSSKTQTRTVRMTTQLHLCSQPKKVTTCFVLNDCSDDSETLANIAGQNVPLPTEVTGQTLLTPKASTASTAVDTRTGSVFDVHAVDDDDEPWMRETDHKSCWNTRFKRGNVPRYAGWSCFARLSQKGRVIDQGRERTSKTCMNFCLLGTKTLAHRRDDFHFTAQNKRADISCSVSKWKQRVLPQRFESAFRQVNVQDSWYRSKKASYATTGPSFMFSTTHGSQGEQLTHEKDISRPSRNLH